MSTDDPSSPPALDADYYLHNFLLILETVLSRDPHLFTPEEQTLFGRLKALAEPALRLYVRLFNRQGPYFRLDRLKYGEIPELLDAAGLLASSGFARLYGSGRPLSGEEDLLELPLALAAFTVPELSIIARAHRLPTGNRPALLAALTGLEPALLTAALLELSALIRLQHRGLLTRVQRLFFLNGFQDATTLVTADLALVRYPRYRILRSGPVFPDREAFEAWLEAGALGDAFSMAVYNREEASALHLGQAALEAFLASRPGRPGFLERYTAREVHAKTAMQFVGWCEGRIGRTRAADLYAALLEAGLPARHRGEAWVRLALHREKVEGLEAALTVCAAGLEETSTRRGERLALLKRQDALLRRRDRQRRVRPRQASPEAFRPPEPSPDSPRDASTEASPYPPSSPAPPPREVVIRRPVLSSGPHRRMHFAGASGTASTVEPLALEAYHAAGVAGLYTENLFFTTLAGILCWDIFFADVPDVFQSPFQDAPLDLNTDAFVENRRELIEARLATLRTGDLSLLYLHHRNWYGVMARGVSWESYSLEELALGASRLGGERLAAIIGHLLEDYRLHRRGMPDLLLWRTGETPSAERDRYWGPAGYTPPVEVWFAEVKSPRDRLSAEQRAWIDALSGMGMTVELCRIEVDEGEDVIRNRPENHLDPTGGE